MTYDILFAATQEAAKDNSWLNISAPWLAFFGTVFGGVGLKTVEHFMNKPSRKDSTPAELREELRVQIEGLKSDVVRQQEEIDQTEKEMLEWRDKYYAIVAQQVKDQRQLLDYLSELNALRDQIKTKEVHKNVNRSK